MWSKYTFTCDPDECDALVEFTARDGFGFPLGVVEMKCPCGRMLNYIGCLLYTSPSPRDRQKSRMPSSA